MTTQNFEQKQIIIITEKTLIVAYSRRNETLVIVEDENDKVWGKLW